MEHTCNISAAAHAGASEVDRGASSLQREFEASLGHLRPCLKKGNVLRLLSQDLKRGMERKKNDRHKDICIEKLGSGGCAHSDDGVTQITPEPQHFRYSPGEVQLACSLYCSVGEQSQAITSWRRKLKVLRCW